MDETDTIGERLRFLRRYRGMTQVQLAGLVGLSPSAISMIGTRLEPGIGATSSMSSRSKGKPRSLAAACGPSPNSKKQASHEP